MKLLKVGKFVTWAIEILWWISMALGIVFLVLYLAWPVFREIAAEVVQVGDLSNATLYHILFIVKGTLISLLKMLQFRAARRIVTKAIKDTPFQPSTVKWIKRIGYYVIAMPVVDFLFNLLMAKLCVSGEIMLNFDETGFVTGILILCLTQAFAYGVELQQDVDGLL